MAEEKNFEREIGAFVLRWDEPSESNGNMAWLVIRAKSGQWETRLRGDMSIVVMWRRLLEDENTEDFLHCQLRLMQLLNQTINDPITELIFTTTIIGNTYMIGRTQGEIDEYNKKRSEIAIELTKLTNGIIPQASKENPVTDEEKAVLNDMRENMVNNDLNESENGTSKS